MDLYSDAASASRSADELGGVLNPDDLEFEPDYLPEGSPTIPVHCELEAGVQCEECYRKAQEKLRFVRHHLEKLRGIHGATKKYVDNHIVFGDSMAGLPGGFGMGWPPQRKGIQDQFEKFEKTCREKYEAYMRELLKGLREIDACEKKYFGQDDWYSRYGFIYYTYMQDRYRL